MNVINLIGRLTRDVELRKTQSQLSVVNFTLAVDDPYKQKDDEQKTDFINCVAWKELADVLNNYTKKGSLIGLSGRLKQKSYTKSDGTKATTYEVVCNSVYLLEKKEQHQDSNSFNRNDIDVNDTFGGPELDISSDELPF